MNQVIMLTLTFVANEKTHSIHPTLLVDDHNVILVDCGYSGFLASIEQEMIKHNVDPKRLNKVFITHHDEDHMGALFELKQKYPHVQVITGLEEADYVSGKKKSLRLLQSESILETADDKNRLFAEAFCKRQRELKHVPVDQTVKEGDLLDWAGGCEVLETPGHMPGHISLHMKTQNIVITGDAAVVENGELKIANPFFTLDMKQADQSLKRLIDLKAKTYYCFHGGIYQGKKL